MPSLEQPAVALFNSSQEVIEREIATKDTEKQLAYDYVWCHEQTDESSCKRQVHLWDSLYKIDETVTQVIERGYKRIALQFPDDLLRHAGTVARLLAEKCSGILDATAKPQTVSFDEKPKFYILADTSYGSCCVDEVAASHFNADFIIHYGQTCLSPTSNLSVKFVFAAQPLDTEQAADQLSNTVTACRDSKKFLLDTDIPYLEHADELLSLLRNKCASDTIITKANVVQYRKPDRLNTYDPNSDEHGTADGKAEQRSSHESIVCHGGFEFTVPGSNGDWESQYTVLYIGSENLALTNVCMSFNRCNVIHFNPTTGTVGDADFKTSRLLSRRYYRVQQARDANIIGIIAGTLSVKSYLDIINNLKKLINAAGKKSYLLALGKLNPAKLANFLEIDVFVTVACPQGSLQISLGGQDKEFYKPVITPFELEVALSGVILPSVVANAIAADQNRDGEVSSEIEKYTGRTWTGDYITDFHELLPGMNCIGALIFCDHLPIFS